MFKKGERVLALRNEFKDFEGEVLEQLNEALVLVKFDNFGMKVVTTSDNLRTI